MHIFKKVVRHIAAAAVLLARDNYAHRIRILNCLETCTPAEYSLETWICLFLIQNLNPHNNFHYFDRKHHYLWTTATIHQLARKRCHSTMRPHTLFQSTRQQWPSLRSPKSNQTFRTEQYRILSTE